MSRGSESSLFGPGIFRLFLAVVVMVHHSLPFRAGSWAVDVFFVLSGYWITQMWANRYSGTRASYFTFLVSRWWRLLPVFLVCTLLGVCSAIFLQGGALSIRPDPTWWFRQIPIAGSTDAGRILPLTWSLDVEMQFYIIAPAVILLFAKVDPRARWFIVGGLLAMLGTFFLHGTPADSARFGLFSGFFLAGTALALGGWVAGWPKVIASLALLFLGLVILLVLPSTRQAVWIEGALVKSPAPWIFNWWVLAAVLMVPFVSRNVRIQSSRFDRFLGNLAYPLYLFHWIPREWYYHLCETTSSNLVRVLLLAANFSVALLGATLILMVIDQPLDRLRARWVASRWIKPAVAGEVAVSENSHGKTGV